MILVTGGTGLVGAHLLYKLCKNHNKIVAIYRNEATQNNTRDIFEMYGDVSNYKRISWQKADITDIPSLEMVFKDITHVYHAAASVSFNPKDFDLLRKVNIEGTANIVNLCLQYNIKKLCFVSSIATLSETPGIEFIDEESQWNPEEEHSDYSITKFGAEMEVWRGAQEGLPIVMVNPGVIFGFGMWHVNTGSLVKKIRKGLLFYTKGITGVVAVSDVTDVMIELMNSNIENERFILVNKNISFKDLFTLIAAKLKVKPPKIYAPKWLTEIIWRINSAVSFLTFYKVNSSLNKFSTKSAHHKTHYTGEKIKKSIDFNYTLFETSIEEIAKKLL